MKSVRFIAEIAKEHGGDIKHAIQLINRAKAVGFDAVKFQCYNTEDLIEGHKNNARNKKAWLSISELHTLKAHANTKGLDFWCSVFSKEAIKPLSQFTSVCKVPSTFFSHVDFVSECISNFNEVHISTGFHSTSDIFRLKRKYKTLGAGKILEFYNCTSLYPTPSNTLRLNRIKDLGLTGFSYHGHEYIPIMNAIILGANLIEVHFGFEDNKRPWVWDAGMAEIIIKDVREELKYAAHMLDDKPLTDEEKNMYEFYKDEFKDLQCLK